jgi:thiol-disulfide isomerase/thioredoxin
MSMKQVRSWVPVLGFLALAALFLSLPEAPNVLGRVGCKTCSSADPYVPLLGAGYFATLIAIALLFPASPGRLVARGGLTWAVLLAGALIYVKWPGVCPVCLFGHACNILIWAIWLTVPAPSNPVSTTVRERLCLTLFAPMAVVALFSTLNLTFGQYGFQVRPLAPTALHPGDAVPDFTAKTNAGLALANSDAGHGAAIVINFVSPNCPYCKEQLPLLNSVAGELASGPYRFVNVSPALPPELVQLAPGTEWVEDGQGTLRALFQVSGSPTLLVLGTDGKIANVIAGVPERFDAQLRASLVKPAGN